MAFIRPEVGRRQKESSPEFLSLFLGDPERHWLLRILLALEPAQSCLGDLPAARPAILHVARLRGGRFGPVEFWADTTAASPSRAPLQHHRALSSTGDGDLVVV